jgi:hypothetical protein
MVVAVSIWKPGASAIFPPCPFHALTHLFCPGCGSTRMIYYLVNGAPWTAFRQNPLAFVCLPFLVVAMLSSAMGVRLPVPADVTRFLTAYSYPLGIGFLVVVTIFTLARNIPAAPFCALAPGGC